MLPGKTPLPAALGSPSSSSSPAHPFPASPAPSWTPGPALSRDSWRMRHFPGVVILHYNHTDSEIQEAEDDSFIFGICLPFCNHFTQPNLIGETKADLFNHIGQTIGTSRRIPSWERNEQRTVQLLKYLSCLQKIPWGKNSRKPKHFRQGTRGQVRC